MNSFGLSRTSAACRLLLAAGALATVAASAEAALTHKYNFNGNAIDSIQGQNGAVIDNTGISSYTGGALDLSANNGANSNQNFADTAVVGAFVDLPNGIFTQNVQSGTPGQISLEMWATPQENRNWARLIDFGTSVGGEGKSDGGGGKDYVIVAAQNALTGHASASVHSAANAEPIAQAPAALTPGIRSHIVVTLNHADSTGGANGTLKFYVNNAAPIVAAIPAGVFLDSIVNDNNWLGRAQYGDPLFDGLIDEFRIYDTALTAAEVNTSYATGPDASPLPVLMVDRNTGAITLKNQTNAPFQVKGYSISSAGGALNAATWSSIDATNAFDNDGTWTVGSNTALNLSESVTGGVLDGGTLAGQASAAIGTPWRRSSIHDLTFTVTLADGTPQAGQVLYTGGDAIRSDLSGNGVIDAADWAIFVPNSFTTFADDPDVTSYLKGDLDGDGDNDYADFKIFKADYIAANGVAAFASLGAAVPEPATLALGGLALIGLGAIRRRSERK